ncbi:MAG: Maf family protein [Brevundimonas sp.]|nr:Maf family protein [Brevundimonas sp.]
MKLILASRSASRRALLEAADDPHETMAAGVDEESAKAALRSDGLNARSLADALAELKATRLSMRFPEDFVLGCDQVLALEDGTMLDKPEDRDDARRQLTRMRGATHRLISAMVICQAGRPVWRHIEVAKLTIRAFSDAFLDD